MRRSTADPPVRPGRNGWWPRIAVVVPCAAVLALSAVATFVRLTGLDDGTVLALPMAVLPWITVAGVVALAGVAVLRAACLTALAAMLTLAQLAWLVPRLVPQEAHVPYGAPRLRVAAVNAYVGRVDPAALVSMVRERRIDVLAVAELPAAAVRALDAAGIAEVLPYREAHPEADSSIFARVPLVEGGLLAAGTAWPQTTAVAEVAGRRVRVIAAGGPGTWLRCGGPHATAVPTRSCSATSTRRSTTRRCALLAAGLTEAHAARGRGWVATWPAGGPLLPLAQIDHVLHGSGLRAVDAGEHTLPGTDHRAVTAELALLP